MCKKKILVIASKFPYPVIDGAAIRTMQMIKMLSKDYSIDLVSICNDLNQNAIQELEKYCDNVITYSLPTWKRFFNSALGLLRKRPLQCSYFFSKKIKKYIEEHENAYDVFFCNNIRTAEYVLKINKYKIIDFVDAISMNYEKGAKHANIFFKCIYQMEYKRCLTYERKLLRLFDKKIIISEKDRDYIVGDLFKPETISIVGNYTEDINEDIMIQNKDKNIVFVGTMSYHPNIVAVSVFAEKIFPLILKEEPDAKFYIVGSRPADKVISLQKNPNVIVTGFVDEPKEYIRSSTVVVAPMYTGAGLQNKILQAMALGAVVLTTPIGIEGLPMIKDELLVKESYEDFSETILHLFNDIEQRQKIGAKAKIYIENNFTFEAIFKQFQNALKR